MTMKSVLLFIHKDPGQEARLQAALDLTRAFEGHLTCVDIVPRPMPVGGVDGGVYAMVMEEERTIEAANRAELESRIAREEVNWDWIDVAGDFTHRLMQEAGLSDVIVVNCKRDRFMTPDPRGIVAQVLGQARCPVVAVPDDVHGFDPCGPAVVAWDGSTPAMIALRGAVPVLKLASSVTLFNVQNGERGVPVEAAAAYLSRQGVHAEIDRAEAGDERPDVLILKACKFRGARYCVMGAFGHGRLSGEMFGGVTRRMLDTANIPLVLGR